MNWSQVRIRIRERMDASLRDRIDLHVAQYRTFGELGRAWITVDGEQVASWSCMEKLGHPPKSEHSKSDFIHILTTHLNENPHEALKSPVGLIRALALADERIGKRTLKSYPIESDEDELVRLVYRLRTEVPKSEASASLSRDEPKTNANESREKSPLPRNDSKTDK